MKLLVICSQYPPLRSPESAHCIMLCEHLAKSGIEVDLVTSLLPATFPTPRGFSLHAIMEGWGWRNLPRLISLTKRLKPDVVLMIYVGWIYHGHPMITFTPTWLRWSVPCARFVVQFENVAPAATVASRLGYFVWQMFRMFSKGTVIEERFGSLLTDSHAVIGLCRQHLDELVRTYPPVSQKAHLIAAPPLLRIRDSENGNARKEGREILGVESEQDTTIVFGYFGYIYRSKGVEYLLPAFALAKKILAKHQIRIRLAIIGGFGEPDLEPQFHAIADQLGISADLTWVGHCEPTELVGSTCLYALDIAVLPFDSGVRLHNSSFAVCATHGLPIITTCGEELEPEFRDGVNILLSEPQNSESLAQKMIVLALSSEMRVKLGGGASQLASHEFSWEHVTRETCKVLDSVRATSGSLPAMP